MILVQDLSGLDAVVLKIIAAKGGIVDDEDFRTGKRETPRKEGTGMLKSRFRRRHRISTNTSIYINSDAKPEYERLLRGEDDDDTEDEESEEERDLDGEGDI